MEKKYFSLSYLISLQNKYKNSFSSTKNEIIVLPPIVNKKKKEIYYFVAEKICNDKITRPIGIIKINYNGIESIINLSNYYFTNYSKDFTKQYEYDLDRQEDIKILLQNLYKLNMKKESNLNDYFNLLEKVLSKQYIQFYLDILNNEIKPIFKDLTKKDFFIDNEKSKNEDLKLQISNFVKENIIKDSQTKSIEKIIFFDNLGAYLKNLQKSQKEISVREVKFEILKIYSIMKTKIEEITLQEEFIAKLLIMFLNSLLIRQIKKQLIEKYEQNIYYTSSIFEEEIDKIENKKRKDYLKDIFSQLQQDSKKFSISCNIAFGYTYIFNQYK